MFPWNAVCNLKLLKGKGRSSQFETDDQGSYWGYQMNRFLRPRNIVAFVSLTGLILVGYTNCAGEGPPPNFGYNSSSITPPAQSVSTRPCQTLAFPPVTFQYGGTSDGFLVNPLNLETGIANFKIGKLACENFQLSSAEVAGLQEHIILNETKFCTPDGMGIGLVQLTGSSWQQSLGAASPSDVTVVMPNGGWPEFYKKLLAIKARAESTVGACVEAVTPAPPPVVVPPPEPTPEPPPPTTPPAPPPEEPPPPGTSPPPPPPPPPPEEPPEPNPCERSYPRFECIIP